MQSADCLKRYWLTWSICVTACLAYLLPGWNDVCIYDRTGIQMGDVWRWWTGHLVHFTLQHLCLDLLVFGISSAMVEHFLRWRGRVMILVAASGISLGLYVFAPALQRFGGLSGLAVFTTTLAILRQMNRTPNWRTIGWLLLGVVCLKVSLETGWPDSSYELMSFSGSKVVKEPLSHAIGLALALLSGAWFRVVQQNAFCEQPRRLE